MFHTNLTAKGHALQQWWSTIGAAQTLTLASVLFISHGAAAVTDTTEVPPAVVAAIKEEHEKLLPLTSFYDVHLLPGKGTAGDLLTVEKATDYQLPDNVSANRFTYRTKGPRNKLVAASGVILIPPGKAPAGGWPIIAWAHGTTGVDRPCANSRMRNLEYGWDELSNLLGLGFAVIATDYQGLGTTTGHPWVDKVTNGGDVIYAVIAARRAMPTLGSRWVAMGHSQGGLAAIGVAEQEAGLKDAGYLGAVAVAFGDAEEVFKRLALPAPQAEYQPYFDTYMAFLVHAVRAVYPEFNETDLLTEEGAMRARSATNHCQEVYAAAFGDVKVRPIVLPAWRENRFVKSFFERDRIRGKIQGPILMVDSGDDEAVPVKAADIAVASLCAAGSTVRYVRYENYGLDHVGVLHATLGLRAHWIQDRFAGQPAENNCSYRSGTRPSRSDQTPR